MKIIRPADAVQFVEEDAEKAFESLRDNDPLKKAIIKAINDLKNNVYCGEKIGKKLIPKEYDKYNIDNLFWYKLTKGWRLVYTVVADEVEILAVIIEYFNHKNMSEDLVINLALSFY